MTPEAALITAVALLGLATITAVPLGRRLGAWAGYPLAGMVGGAHLVLVSVAGHVVDAPIEVSGSWIPEIGARWALRLDGLALVFALAVTGVGAAVLLYSPRYLDRDRRCGGYYGALAGFAAAMTALVMAGDGLVLYAGWEGTTATSFLLIATRASGRAAARRALFITFASGLALLAALLFGAASLDTLSLRALGAPGAWPDLALGGFAALLVVAAAGKSAQVPLHVWLPPAMVAPSPISAYLHAAAMVAAGFYLLLRFGAAIASQPAVAAAVVVLGTATALFGAAAAVSRRDLKELLAYSTIGHVGFMIALVGVGTGGAILGALGYFVAHATYKSALFLAAGAYDRELGTRSLPELGGAARRLPLVTAALVASCLSMAGIAPALGYVAKDAALAALLELGAAGVAVAIGLALALALSVVYSIRVAVAPFRRPPDDAAERRRPAAAWSLAIPIALLAAATVVLGAVPSLVAPVLEAGVEAVTGAAPDQSLALWHGATASFALSLGIIGAGGLGYLWYRRRGWPRVFPDNLGARAADAAGRGVRALGAVLAAAIARARPPGQLAVVFAATAAAAIIALAWSLRSGAAGVPSDPIARWVVCALFAGAALAVVQAGDRIAAFAALSVVGFLVAIWYLLHGAPQLATAQLVVDGLTVALSLFVLRRLPRSFAASERRGRAGAAGLALAGGVAFAGLSLFQRSRDLAPPSARYLERARASGSGNLVSEIIGEYRALDTLGETAVVALAALGVVAVLRSRRELR